MVIHENRRRDVHGTHQHETFTHLAGLHFLHNLFSYVDDLLAPLRIEPEIMRMGLHPTSDWLVRRAACRVRRSEASTCGRKPTLLRRTSHVGTPHVWGRVYLSRASRFPRFGRIWPCHSGGESSSSSS